MGTNTTRPFVQNSPGAYYLRLCRNLQSCGCSIVAPNYILHGALVILASFLEQLVQVQCAA